MTSLKYLAIVVALLAGGAALAMIGFLTRQQIISRQASAPESAPTAHKSRPADQLVSEIGQTSPVATVQEAQSTSTPSTGPTQIESAQNSMGPATGAIPPCDKPDGLGLSRIVQIDTTGGPRFGLIQHPQGYDFLRDKEVVLTFDDGPWPGSTAAVLKALADQCVKATFFEIGEYARWHPEITRQVIDAGMTVGTYTWSHKDLARNPYANEPEKAEHEIEMGNSAVHSVAPGGKVAPFFRFPGLQPSSQLASYLADRNIAIFSTDIDSRDFTMHKPEPVVDSVMSQLEKRGKGIVLLQDFHRNTAEALPELLRQLKLAGYKVVHMVPKDQLTTLPKYDEMFNPRENVSSTVRPGAAAAPGHMYMYAPAHKRAPTTGTTGAH
jgi:peptidoglycan/xylan/chitin deacetylase (PgdA/CDA1 family)